MARPGGGSITLAEPEVRLLAVAPAARGRGVGAALMDECVRRACQSGAAVLTLHTTDIMQAAVRLYERLGFRRAPELDIQPAPGVTIKGYRLGLEGATSCEVNGRRADEGPARALTEVSLTCPPRQHPL
jgi:hypothetical protein